MPNPLFSTYSQGENRVTSTILAVFERLSVHTVELIMRALTGESVLSMVTYRNQPRGKESVPDGLIKGSFAYWIETKTVPNALDADQLRRHLKTVERGTEEQSILLVITPDATPPDALRSISSERLFWVNFASFVDTIRGILEPDDCDETIDRLRLTEREVFLLQELIDLILSEGLSERGEDRVVIVSARTAISDYERYHAYICQPFRSFRPAQYMGFYYGNQIDRRFPRILDSLDTVILSDEGINSSVAKNPARAERLRVLVDLLRRASSPRYGHEYKVIFLSPPGDPQTITLDNDIQNDLSSDSGRRIAFTQGQRYISRSLLSRNPRRTSELVNACKP